jgi:hypothetical protein
MFASLAVAVISDNELAQYTHTHQKRKTSFKPREKSKYGDQV